MTRWRVVSSAWKGRVIVMGTNALTEQRALSRAEVDELDAYQWAVYGGILDCLWLSFRGLVRRYGEEAVCRVAFRYVSWLPRDPVDFCGDNTMGWIREIFGLGQLDFKHLRDFEQTFPDFQFDPEEGPQLRFGELEELSAAQKGVFYGALERFGVRWPEKRVILGDCMIQRVLHDFALCLAEEVRPFSAEDLDRCLMELFKLK